MSRGCRSPGQTARQHRVAWATWVTEAFSLLFVLLFLGSSTSSRPFPLRPSPWLARPEEPSYDPFPRGGGDLQQFRLDVSEHFSHDPDPEGVVVYCMSDLHLRHVLYYESGAVLHNHRKRIERALQSFVVAEAAKTRAVYFVLLGDIFDDWAQPHDASPVSLLEVMESHVWFRDLMKKLREEHNIGIIYVRGNHDMGFPKSSLEDAIATFFRGSVDYGGDRLFIGDVVFEHGHRYDVFNSRRFGTESDHGVPFGYFLTRLAASSGSLEDDWMRKILFKGVQSLCSAKGGWKSWVREWSLLKRVGTPKKLLGFAGGTESVSFQMDGVGGFRGQLPIKQLYSKEDPVFPRSMLFELPEDKETGIPLLYNATFLLPGFGPMRVPEDLEDELRLGLLATAGSLYPLAWRFFPHFQLAVFGHTHGAGVWQLPEHFDRPGSELVHKIFEALFHANPKGIWYLNSGVCNSLANVCDVAMIELKPGKIDDEDENYRAFVKLARVTKFELRDGWLVKLKESPTAGPFSPRLWYHGGDENEREFRMTTNPKHLVPDKKEYSAVTFLVPPAVSHDPELYLGDLDEVSIYQCRGHDSGDLDSLSKCFSRPLFESTTKSLGGSDNVASLSEGDNVQKEGQKRRFSSPDSLFSSVEYVRNVSQFLKEVAYEDLLQAVIAFRKENHSPERLKRLTESFRATTTAVYDHAVEDAATLCRNDGISEESDQEGHTVNRRQLEPLQILVAVILGAVVALLASVGVFLCCRKSEIREVGTKKEERVVDQRRDEHRAMSPRGQSRHDSLRRGTPFICVVGLSKKISCFDAETLKMMHEIPTPTQNLRIVTIPPPEESPDDDVLVAVSELGSPYETLLYDPFTKKLVRKMKAKHSDSIWGLSYLSPDLVVSGDDSEVYVSNVRTGMKVLTLEDPPNYTRRIICCNESTQRGGLDELKAKQLVFVSGWGGDDGYSIRFYDLKSERPNEVIRKFVGHTGGVGGLSYSSTDGLLVSTSGDGTLRIWSIRDKQSPSQSVSLSDRSSSVYYESESHMAFCGIKGGYIEVFDIRNTSQRVQKFRPHDGGESGTYVTDIIPTVPGKYVSVDNSNCSVALWTSKGKKIASAVTDDYNFGVCYCQSST